MYPYTRGDWILLGGFQRIILDVSEDKALVTSLQDLRGRNAKWVLKRLLPVPHAHTDLDKERGNDK